MDVKEPLRQVPSAHRTLQRKPSRWLFAVCLLAVFLVLTVDTEDGPFSPVPRFMRPHKHSPYGRFPLPDDPFHFLPCTEKALPPALDDPRPERSWKKLFDPEPSHWSWGNGTDNTNEGISHGHRDPYAGRGIYLCGYLDVPLDYTNKSDPRIARLAVSKFQVSGLAPSKRHRQQGLQSRAGQKSSRTLVVNPGGPGGSGTSFVWRMAEDITARLSDGKYDVLGWDPRGVNTSLPAISCFPDDSDRDHWALRINQYREISPSPRAQLEFVDAMSDSILNACYTQHGDVPRFMTTAFVARDLEQIRLTLGEDELSGIFVSYGTGIGQTYANMFPDSVGRMILDGTEYVRDHRLVGGFGWTALDNGTDAWHDGFLGECIHAGPGHCALAKPTGPQPVTLNALKQRMKTLITSLIDRPVVGYTESRGPSLITYSALIGVLYQSMYSAPTWPALAQMLAELEAGNSTLAAEMLEKRSWEYDPTLPAPPSKRPSSDELGMLVICGDSYDAPDPGMDWWESLWQNMTERSWIAGNSRFQNVFPCRHFTDYWPQVAEVYRGDLNHTLRNPMLLIAETYDPATPLRNGRRLLHEMGRNARLVAHHGYGHSSRDKSQCTDTIVQKFILEGVLPEESETACYADGKPYLYESNDKSLAGEKTPLQIWEEHVAEMSLIGF